MNMLYNDELANIFFEFDLQNMHFEESIVRECLVKNYLTEEQIFTENLAFDITEFIMKIFEKIVGLLDKVIISARKAFTKLGLESVKKKIQTIRESTKEPKEGEFTFIKPNSPLVKKENITNINPKNLGFHINKGDINVELNSELFQTIMNASKEEKRREGVDKAKSIALQAMKDIAINNVTLPNDNQGDDITKMATQKQEIKINKSNCRSQLGELEKLFKIVEEYFKKDFNDCVKSLNKVRSECRLFCMIRTTQSNVKSIQLDGKMKKDRNLTAMYKSTAVYYSKLVSYMTKYMFKTASFYLSSLKQNIKGFESMIL